MLTFGKDRLDYGQMLLPPDGFKLHRAMAATYSLDLDTLLSIPVALFFSQTMEGDLKGARLELLKAIQDCPEYLRIYHQAGKIQVPRKHNRLYAFIEESVVGRMPPGNQASFHPKVWVLRYVGMEEPGEVRYRVLVLSRNLTYDRSWDLAVQLDGELTRGPIKRNEPLVAFCQELLATKPFGDAPQFLDDLRCVQFHAPSGFMARTFSFHPSGVGGRQNPIAAEQGNRVICISPFVNKKGLAALRRLAKGQRVLLSRKEELDMLDARDLEGFQVYHLSGLVVEGESLTGADDGGEEPKRQNLHAKLYVIEDDNGAVRWFLGSANCSGAALKHNVEFLQQLRVSSHGLTFDKLLNEELLKPAGVFEPYTPREVALPNPEDPSLTHQLRTLEYDLLKKLIAGASLSRRPKGGNYDLSLKLAPARIRWRGLEVRLAPFNCDVPFQAVNRDAPSVMVFENINETALSRFFRVQILRDEEILRAFLVKVDIDMPASRGGKILRSLIADQEQFFRYLNFLLADGFEAPTGPGGADGKPGGRKDTRPPWEANAPLYEQLLLAASRRPKRLAEIDRLITQLQARHAEEEADGQSGEAEEIVPPEFLTFWAPFRELYLDMKKKSEESGGRRKPRGKRKRGLRI